MAEYFNNGTTMIRAILGVRSLDLRVNFKARLPFINIVVDNLSRLQKSSFNLQLKCLNKKIKNQPHLLSKLRGFKAILRLI